MIVHTLSKDQSLEIDGHIIVRIVDVRDDEVEIEIEYPEGSTVRPGGACGVAGQARGRAACVAACCG